MAHTLISSSDLACALGVQERTIHRRAKKEGWQVFRQKVRGGHQYHYVSECLPNDVRPALALQSSAPNPAATCGFTAGGMLQKEIAAAATAKRQTAENGLAQFATLSPERQSEAEAKRAVLDARDAFILAAGLPKKRGSQIFAKDLQTGRIALPVDVFHALPKRAGKIVISWPSLARWEKAYKTHGLAGLASDYKTTRQTTVTADCQQFIEALIYEKPHITISGIMHSIEARYRDATPDKTAVRRWVKKWKKENATLFLFLSDPDAWKSARRWAVGDASARIERLNQLWEMDSTPTDIMLVDGRHTIIGCMDIYSRRLKMLVSPTSKSDAVAALIRNCLLDWGVPETIKTDNGADYVSKHVVRVIDALEIDQELCTPFSPEEKPHIERVFHTFSHGLMELMPGFIGHNVAERKRIEARRTFAQRLMKTGADPVDVNMTAAQMQTFCDQWCDAIYHQNPHGSLNNQTPAAMARAWKTPIRRIENERALDILLSPAPSGGGLRQITKKGVSVENRHYFAVEMVGHEGEDVQVLLDRADAGAVYLYRENGAFLCKAVNPEISGIRRSDMAKIMKTAQTEFYAGKKKELKKQAKEAGVAAIHEEIMTHRLAEIENVVDLPQRAEAYTTPALEEAAKAAASEAKRGAMPVPPPITDEQEAVAGEIIDLAGRAPARRLPSTEWERYEMIMADLRSGLDVPDADVAWCKRYDIFLETGDPIESIN